MKRIFLMITGLFLIWGLIGCGKEESADIYGKYSFEEVTYLSPLSSSTADFLAEKMAGTEYTIERDMFKIGFADNAVEIPAPDYVPEEVPKSPGPLSDVCSFIGEELQCQYTIYTKDGAKTHWRLYASKDALWIASYADNTADGSEIIMGINKLFRNIKD
jgi:hypothetical protein